MTRRKTLTDNMVAKMKPGETRLTVSDPEMRGHFVRITPSGAKSYCVVTRNPEGKQIWATIGSTDHHGIDESRNEAREVIRRIKAGLTPFEPPPIPDQTFKVIADNFMVRHVKAKGLRSQAEIERILNKFVLPVWKDREFTSIGRADVTKLLDSVEDNSGPRQADYVLAIVRKITIWHESRSDDYRSPITRNMGRSDSKARQRTRILDDDEIRTIWRVAEVSGTYGAIIRLLLLTAQRREKVATLKWNDVIDDTWIIQTEEREKGNGGALVLPDAAINIIKGQERLSDNPYIFAGRGSGHFKGFSPCKRAFDKQVMDSLHKAAAERGEVDNLTTTLPNWTLHDLRRTARSLMARVGVRPDIAERVMGHVIAGVEGVYDRYDYRDEKADALKKLASQIEMILIGQDNEYASN